MPTRASIGRHQRHGDRRRRRQPDLGKRGRRGLHPGRGARLPSRQRDRHQHEREPRHPQPRRGVHLTSGPGGIEVGGSENSESNVIGGNSGDGIFVGSANAQITALRRRPPWRHRSGNSGNGIEVAGEALVGGTGPFQKGNEIAFNNGAGIGVRAVSRGSPRTRYTTMAGRDRCRRRRADAERSPRFRRRSELPPNGPVITSVISSGFRLMSASISTASPARRCRPTHSRSNPSRTRLGRATRRAGKARRTSARCTHDRRRRTRQRHAQLAGTSRRNRARGNGDRRQRRLPWTSEFSGCATVPSS